VGPINLDDDDEEEEQLLAPHPIVAENRIFEHRKRIRQTLPPEWVDTLEICDEEILRIRRNISKLHALHVNRLKVRFDDDESSHRHTEMEMDAVSSDIAKQLKKIEHLLKSVATNEKVGGGDLSQEERNMRLNVMRGIGTKIRNVSAEFRKTQKDFLNRLKGQEMIGDQFFSGESEKEELLLEDALDAGLSADQLCQLEEMERESSEREKEIINVARSINDMANIFRELSVLVIEQGTVLDRIDYNIEQTLVSVKQGTQELEKANEISKKSKTIKCIILLICINIFFMIVLLMIHTNIISLT